MTSSPFFMKLHEVTSKEEWENFLSTQTEKTFLQSWNWGNFNTAMGSKVWNMGLYQEDKLMGVALVIKVAAKRGTFFFIPHGPVLTENLSVAEKKTALLALVSYLKELGKKEKAAFIRIAPLWPRTKEYEELFAAVGCRKSPIHASAYEATWKLDLAPEAGQLLSQMRKTTRYLIKKAGENPDISIEKSTDPADISRYQKLNHEVAKRQQFTPFSDAFIQKEFEAFAPDGQALFLFGKYKEETVAGAMVIFWSGMAFYHQAASLGAFSKYSTPYLLQWQAVQEAKARGCRMYDFWGFTDPAKYPKHPWAGPTLFKMGFGGFSTAYVHTQDIPLSKKYWINYIIETARKLKRGL